MYFTCTAIVLYDNPANNNKRSYLNFECPAGYQGKNLFGSIKVEHIFPIPSETYVAALHGSRIEINGIPMLRFTVDRCEDADKLYDETGKELAVVVTVSGINETKRLTSTRSDIWEATKKCIDFYIDFDKDELFPNGREATIRCEIVDVDLECTGSKESLLAELPVITPEPVKPPKVTHSTVKASKFCSIM